MEFLSSQSVLHNFISSVAQNFIARFSLIPNNLGPLQIRSNLNTWINITYCYQYNNHNLYSRHVKEYKSLSQSVEEAGNSWGSSGHQGITGFAVHQHFRYKSQLGLAAAWFYRQCHVLLCFPVLWWSHHKNLDGCVPGTSKTRKEVGLVPRNLETGRKGEKMST